jgi:hypothetical protein
MIVEVPMTNGELLDLLESEARLYRKGARSSVRRNQHQNEVKVFGVRQEMVDALLVDFINFIAVGMGGDLGLTSKHLRKRKKK